jgi:hypothetical protein
VIDEHFGPMGEAAGVRVGVEAVYDGRDGDVIDDLDNAGTAIWVLALSFKLIPAIGRALEGWVWHTEGD